MIYLLVTAWYISGVASFIYWWIKEHDFTTDTAIFTIYVGFGGPLMFFVGYVLHDIDLNKSPKILIRKQK